MIRALWSAASGMKAQQMNLDITSNNLANVNTTGFKKARAEFQDLYYQTLKQAGAPVATGVTQPEGLQIGMGVQTVATNRFFSQGDFQQTENTFDLVIKGQGFFRVQLPDGTEGYTRSGNFSLNANGQITTPEGYLLDPGFTINPDSTNVTITEDGRITQRVNNATEDVGQITLYKFINPAGLDAIGRNIWKETPASGNAVNGIAGLNGLGQIGQGVLEMSNVKVADEMVNMIVAMRAYEANSKAITTSDEMLQVANGLRR